ncbi:MAG TPA: SDR family oxidoreductase [Gammaproteobacteria bacterium]|nr:SDR family oxidoreductase [Gammaproteobacteria bacterium]
MELAGQRILLTGASGGIGVPLARRLADAGARLALVGRRPSPLEDLADGLDGAAAVVADIGTPGGCQEAAAGVNSAVGGVDVLINLAGAFSFNVFAEEDPETFERLFRTNVVAPMTLTRLVLPTMLAQGRGRVVNVGSVLGSLALPWFTTYSSTKFALRGFSEALRRELAGTGVGVTYVAPRAVRTAMNPDAVYRMAEATGMRMDPPETVAAEIEKAIRRDAREHYVGRPESIFARINALLPGLVDRALRKQGRETERFAKADNG